MEHAIPVYFYFNGSLARGGFMPTEEYRDEMTQPTGEIMRPKVTSAPSEEQKEVLESAIFACAPVLAEAIVDKRLWRLTTSGRWERQ